MAEDQTAPVPADWYPDPYGVSEMRWWDGQNWTNSVHPPAAPAAPAPAAPTPEPAATVEPTSFAMPAATPAATPESSSFAMPASASAEQTVSPQDPFGALGLSTPVTESAPQSAQPAHEAQAPQAQEAQAQWTQPPAQAQVPSAVDVPPLVPPTLVSPNLAPPTPGSLLPEDALGAMPAQVSPSPAHQVPSQPTPAQAPPATAPATQAPLEQNPFVASAAQEQVSDESAPTPAASEPELDAPVAPSTRLPSRREMRLRNELEAEGPSSVSAFSEQTVFPAPEPEAAPPTVPDSSTPTAFDWLPSASGGGLGTLPPPSSAAASPRYAAAPTAATESDQQNADQSGFPPLGTKTAYPSGATHAHNSFADEPSPVTDAWSRKSEPHGVAVQEEIPRSTATRKSTVSGWVIALMPLLGAVLSIAAVKGMENYPRYLSPTIFKWWMLVAVVVGVLYLVTILFAVADRSKLDWAGYNRPAHWAWAILTAPVYLLVRTISIKRETGRFSILLAVWLLSVLALVGAWFAAGQFAPELIAGYTLPFLE